MKLNNQEKTRCSLQFVRSVKEHCDRTGYSVSQITPGSDNFRAYRRTDYENGSSSHIKVAALCAYPKSYVVEVSMNFRKAGKTAGLYDWVEVKKCITDLEQLKIWEDDVMLLSAVAKYFL